MLMMAMTHVQLDCWMVVNTSMIFMKGDVEQIIGLRGWQQEKLLIIIVTILLTTTSQFLLVVGCIQQLL